MKLKDFCQKFGVLGNPHKIWIPLNKTAFGNQTFYDFDPEIEDPEQKDTRGSVFPDQKLCSTTTLWEFQREQNAMKETLQFLVECENAKNARTRLAAKEKISMRIAGELTKVVMRPVWNKREMRWVTQWDSLTLCGLMYLMLAFDLQSPGRNLLCGKCGRFFLAVHARSEYCSPRCQNAAKVARFRRKERMRHRKRLGDKGKES
ncbi:CGNR zinc finger domain-containing protein [Candidatus Nitronereus thalassa]|uniref:Zinc finger CGNR domain-containing protein n=1 Tax=Candidatus Nitronereus thalassa TaxID=3020898 RepID=A0ABU3K9F9_9BACT|nr:hypothetical protein [Candidatus Nitronereus thalassa]MDT7042928.1 hypothetical protein [Candidatus Nitronereus thalassa]